MTRLASFVAVFTILLYGGAGMAQEHRNVAKGRYRDVKVSGQMFKRITVGGIEWFADESEDGHFFFQTSNGKFFIADAHADRAPLEERTIYFARLASEEPCGASLPDRRPAPAECVAEEFLLSWPKAKEFVRRSVLRGSSKLFSENVERFLKD